MSLTPNLGMDIPVVEITIGPTWAEMLNAALDIIDEHDHTSGKGLAITVAALNINQDLPLNSYNLTNTNSVQLDQRTTNVSQNRSLYVKSGELYFRDNVGNFVQITQAGSVIGPFGNISGLVSPASASYSSLNKDFTFDYDTAKPARLNIGDIRLYPFDGTTSYSNFATIKVPTSLASQTTFTLPLYTGTVGLDFGAIPIGAVIPIFTNLPGSFSIPGSGSVSNGFMRCDGSLVPAGQSITVGTTLPDLTSSVFINGSTLASNTYAGANSITPTGTINSQTATGTQDLSHSHGLGSHTHTYSHIHQMFRVDASYDGLGGINSQKYASYASASNAFANSIDTDVFNSSGGAGWGGFTGGSPYNNGLPITSGPPSSSVNDVARYYTSNARDGSGNPTTTTSGPTGTSDSTSLTVNFSNATISAASFTGVAFDNRPKYLQAQYVIRVK